MTPRNKKPGKPAWVEEITKKVILKKEGSFVKVIQEEIERLLKGKIYVPIKRPPVIPRSAEAMPESVFAECNAFAKKSKKRKAVDFGMVEVLPRQLLVSHVLCQILFDRCDRRKQDHEWPIQHRNHQDGNQGLVWKPLCVAKRGWNC